MVPLLFAGLWLPWLRAPVEVEAQVARYLRVLALALPGALMFRAIYAVNTAVSRPHVVMTLQLTGLALKVCLSSVLILGGLGVAGMGAVGGAVASVVVFWALFVMGFGYMHRSPFYRRFAIHWTWPRWPALREILQLGIPMSLSYALEATSFTAITLLAARLGTTVMGGHQVVANLAALCFMLPLSLSVATATLTAQAIGAAIRGARARRRSWACGSARSSPASPCSRCGCCAAASSACTRSDPAVAAIGADPDSLSRRLSLLRRAADGRELRAPGLQDGHRAHRHSRRRAVGAGRGRRLPASPSAGSGVRRGASRACG